MKSFIFLDVMLYNQHKAGNKHSSACYLHHAGFLLGLFFGTEDGGDMVLQYVG
jgi:hypothetical protein